MMTLSLSLLGCALAFLSPVAALTDLEMASALKGEVVVRTDTFTTPEGKSAGRGVGAIAIDRSIDAVWAVISRYDDKAEYQPRVDKVEILAREGERMRIRMTIDASVTTARYTGWFQLDAKAHTIAWKIDKTATDNTINDAEGGYSLQALSPTRTLVVYRSYVDSGRAVPQFIQNYMAKKSIPDLLHAVQKRVESGGTYKK